MTFARLSLVSIVTDPLNRLHPSFEWKSCAMERELVELDAIMADIDFYKIDNNRRRWLYSKVCASILHFVC
jgi:hypothetical protein